MNPPGGAIAPLNASWPVIGGMNPPAGAIALLNAFGIVDSAVRACYPTGSFERGHSSAGRALEWHSRGRRFDPAWLHKRFQCLHDATVHPPPSPPGCRLSIGSRESLTAERRRLASPRPSARAIAEALANAGAGTFALGSRAKRHPPASDRGRAPPFAPLNPGLGLEPREEAVEVQEGPGPITPEEDQSAKSRGQATAAKARRRASPPVRIADR